MNFLEGKDARFPEDALRADLERVRKPVTGIRADTTTPDMRLADDPLRYRSERRPQRNRPGRFLRRASGAWSRDTSDSSDASLREQTHSGLAVGQELGAGGREVMGRETGQGTYALRSGFCPLALGLQSDPLQQRHHQGRRQRTNHRHCRCLR
jgi:hypothetical protein